VHDAAVEHPVDRCAHLGHVVAEHVGEDAGEEVEVLPAVATTQAPAGAADDLQRLLVVERHPVREHGPVPGE
jgi:hypothetical protein